MERAALLRRLSPVPLATLAAFAVWAALPDGQASSAVAHGPPVSSRVLAQSYLVASAGGSVRATNGVELRVPPHTMRRSGVASITEVAPGQFDVHIAAPWKGTVTVLFPWTSRSRSASHRAHGRRIVQRVRVVHRRARLRVHNLSVFATSEPLQYAIETMNMSYREFVARKADFTRAGCNADEPKGGCTKPAPYNAFNWTSDGCSGLILIKETYNRFRDPCQMHDFGYRNFGNGLRLGRDDDTRAWIDNRLTGEMRRLCKVNFPHLWQAANKMLCLTGARVVFHAVRFFAMRAFYGSNVTPQPVPPPASAPTPSNPTPPSNRAPPQRSAEQQGSLGANTFTNPYNASGMGVKVQPYQWVQVTCKVYAPQIANVNPDGYWYRIASAPWSNAYYAVANTFWNGDVPGQKPYTHNTDFAVPTC